MAQDLQNWADGHQLGYLAWTWNTWGSGDSLLTNDADRPTSWGVDFRNRCSRSRFRG